jgi:terminal-alkyne amino-acid exporter
VSRDGEDVLLSQRHLGSLALAVTVVTWASAFPAITTGLRGYGPSSLGLGRLLVAALALGVVAVVRPPGIPPRRLWWRVALAGFVGQTAYQWLLMTGEVRVPAGTASILIAIAPIFSVIGAAVLLGESARGRWLGMGVACTGAVLVGLSLGLGGGAAALLVLAAAACQGIYHVLVKPLAVELGAFPATIWTVWAGAALALPALPGLLRDAPVAGLSATAAAVYLGLVPTALGYVAWSAAVRRTPIAVSTVALYLVPVVAVLLAWWWLAERPAPLAVVGGALAIVGVVLTRRGPASTTVATAPERAVSPSR